MSIYHCYFTSYVLNMIPLISREILTSSQVILFSPFIISTPILTTSLCQLLSIPCSCHLSSSDRATHTGKSRQSYDIVNTVPIYLALPGCHQSFPWRFLNLGLPGYWPSRSSMSSLQESHAAACAVPHSVRDSCG